MAAEINFYQADETIIKSLAPLLIKVLDEKKKALIFCKNAAQIKAIDDSLWSYGRSKFIPHITISDTDFVMERQPILISDKEENANKADYLVFFDLPSSEFLSSFKRVFHFFEEAGFSNAAALAKKVKPTNCYKKSDGKWVKFSF
ncbi:MAG: DNA polymerase III subunit chi [Rickettsiales bacterium]|nr:DNA polymerase III subunit chi [Rickettsiales bacterium]